MIFRRNSSCCFNSPTLVYERRRVVEKDSFPSRAVKVSFKQVCLNDDSHLHSLLEYDCDKLQKDIAVGVNLDFVNTRILNPDHVSDLDLQKVSSAFEASSIAETSQENIENV